VKDNIKEIYSTRTEFCHCCGK